jgi:hypothetical protein
LVVAVTARELMHRVAARAAQQAADETREPRAQTL